MGITGINLVDTGVSHLPERLPCPSVPSDQRDNTWYTGLTYNLQCGSGNSGK